ncbi:MAG TPA: thioesterase family protein [Cyclobacteriaceae bacterium]|nr:thioesterase family protein [Cyclobacteriaceae bacterium]
MFVAENQIRVRYAETDQMGYVYYGNYAMYYEVGRVEALRSIGFSYRQMEDEGIMMPVLESHSRYLKPGKYDELLTVRTTIKEMPGVRIKFNYEVVNELGELINLGETMLAFLKTNTHQPCRPPAYLLALLKPYFE